MLFCCQHLTLNKVAIWYLIFTKPDGLLYVRDHFKLLKLLFLFLSLTLADSLLDKSDFMSRQINPGRYPRTFQPIIDLSRRDFFFFLSFCLWQAERRPERATYVGTVPCLVHRSGTCWLEDLNRQLCAYKSALLTTCYWRRLARDAPIGLCVSSGNQTKRLFFGCIWP